MGQVTVTLNGRTYTLSCLDGEEPRLIELATYVKERAEAVTEEFQQVGDDRVLLMTAILIADELAQARSEQAQVASARSAGNRLAPTRRPNGA
jgi:cell division protein ZapA